jgi:hypothetical protein
MRRPLAAPDQRDVAKRKPRRLLQATAAAGCGGSAAGPFAWPKDAGTTVSGVPVRTGQFAVTAIYLLGTADKPAVLLDVRPQHPEDAGGLTIRYAASTGRGMHLGGDRGWHPARWDLRPLAGFAIPAHRHASVVVGAAAAKTGIYLLRGFIVDYRIGSSHYSAPQQHGLQICVGKPCP